MSDAARTEQKLEEGAFLPGDDFTPFAEFSRLMLVGIDSGQHNHILWTAQTTPNGPWDRKYAPVNTEFSYTVLGTGSTTDGRVAMVAQTRTSPVVVHYIDEAPDAPSCEERWNAPVDLGLPAGVAGFDELAMIRDADGRVEVFGVDGGSGEVWWIYQNPPKIVERTEHIIPPGSTTPITVHVKVPVAPDTPWSTWTSLPGDGVAQLTVADEADGRITIIGTGRTPSAAAVYVNSQTKGTALTPADWTGWSRIDDAASGTAGSKPTAVLDPEGFLNIFMVGAGAEIVQTRQTKPNSQQWSEWYRPGMIGKTLVNATAGFDGDGDVVLVALDEKLGLHANYQADALNQIWSGWQQIGVAPGFGLVAIDFNADGSLTYFQGESKINGIKFITQVAPDSTSWTAGWTMLADNGMITYGIVRDLTPPEES